MPELSRDFVVELKEDIPDIIMYCIPELMYEDWIHIYDERKELFILFGNRKAIVEYINNTIKEYT